MSRRVLTSEQRALQERFKLSEWMNANGVRQRLYFDGVDDAKRVLQGITSPNEPADSALMKMVAIMVSEDDSLTNHVLQRNDVDYSWSDLHLATAGMIIERHFQEADESQ